MGKVFFPLDEELGLLPGHLAPRQQEHLVHLACFMPFDKVAQMMEEIVSVQTNEEMVRRLTEQVGSWMEAAQTAEVEAGGEPESEDAEPLQRCVISADGAMISLIHTLLAQKRAPLPLVSHKRSSTPTENERSMWAALVFFAAGGCLHLYASGARGDATAQRGASEGGLCRHGWGRLVAILYRHAST